MNNSAVLEQALSDKASVGSPDPGNAGVVGGANDSHTEITLDLRIARHFVEAMTQLPELEPESTLLVFSPRMRRNDMVKALHRAAAEVGYAVRYDWEAENGKAVHVLHDRDRDSEGRYDSYELSVGAVEFRRSFRTQGTTGVRPRGPLYIRGADAGHVVVDDTLSE